MSLWLIAALISGTSFREIPNKRFVTREICEVVAEQMTKKTKQKHECFLAPKTEVIK